MAQHLMRNGSLSQSHTNQAFLSSFDALANRLSNLIGFAEAKADQSILITGDYKRAETKASSAFDDFGHAVDMNHLFFNVQPLGIDSLRHENLPIARSRHR